MKIIKSIPPPQPNNLWVGVDSEWFGLNENQMHRPLSGRFGCLTISTDYDTVYYIDNPNEVEPALQAIQDCVWCIHKAGFDVVQLRRHASIPPRKKLWDTMLIEKVLWNGYYDKFAADDLARRYLNIYMDKSLQKSFSKSDSMSDDQINYACTDAMLELQIALEQKKSVSANDFKIWSEIDRPTLWAILDFQGFAINVDAWTKAAENNLSRQQILKEQIPFNPNSSSQVKEWFSKHKIKLESSDVDHLEEFIESKKSPPELVEIARMILDSRMYGKRASTYGLDFITDFIEYDNGVPVIVSEFQPNWAETGRFSSSNPNMQNIPVRDTLEFRDCFIARPGNKLVIADYSAQEPRVTAYLTQDKKLKEIFDSGKDIYIEMAREIFGETITKSDPRRKQMKSVILGAMYGLSKWGLASKEEMEVEEADRLLTKTFTLFPDIKTWMKKQQKNKTCVHTIAGRKLWVNPYSSQVERNVLNSPIQGSSADMMKKAIIMLHQTWDFGCPFGIVAPVHDELVLDVPESLTKDVAFRVNDVMVQAAETMCPGIPFKADVIIADRWSEKS